jgi:hypothetical protein
VRVADNQPSHPLPPRERAPHAATNVSD